MRLIGRVAAVESVTRTERTQMFSLMDTYYEHMDRSVFDADLEQKQWVILLEDPVDGVVRGFSTQTLFDVLLEDRKVRVLFSGDTIVDRKFWADNPLAQIWGQFALSLIDSNNGIPLYWFLIAKGYKTYRFLPLFFHEFYPSCEVPTSSWASLLIHTLGRKYYPKAYDESVGIVRAERLGCRLRPGVADIHANKLRDQHIRFFIEKNPAHARGDELCCIAPLSRENFTSAAYRVIGSTPAFLGALP